MAEKKYHSLKKTAQSVAAALIGIQSEKNRQQDFTHGKFSHFIILGIIAVLLFIGALVVVVSVVVP